MIKNKKRERRPKFRASSRERFIFHFSLVASQGDVKGVLIFR